MKRLSYLLLLAGFLLPIVSSNSFAWPYYGYYYGPYRVYRPVDPFPPSGAALGPWKWTVDFGGGPTVVTGSAHDHLSDGWNFNLGFGYNFTPRAGLMLEFMNTGLGLTNRELQQNQAVDGNAGVWGVTLDPIWRFRVAGPVGAYLIGGGGYYQRDARYTLFDPFFGYYDVHQVDDAGGVNIGAGLTFNLGWGTKFFMEARYHYLFTPGYPTQIIPVTFGLRW